MEGFPIKREPVVIILLGSLAVVLGLALLSGGKGSHVRRGPPWLEVGDSLGGIMVTTEEQAQRPLATGGPLLLLVFDPACEHCRAVIPLWKGLEVGSNPAVQVATLTSGTLEASVALFSSVEWHPEIWTTSEASGLAGHRPITTRVPWFFLLDGGGVILAQGHGRSLEAFVQGGSATMPIGTQHP